MWLPWPARELLGHRVAPHICQPMTNNAFHLLKWALIKNVSARIIPEWEMDGSVLRFQVILFTNFSSYSSQHCKVGADSALCLLSAANWHGETRVGAGLAGRFELNGCNHARFPTSLAWGWWSWWYLVGVEHFSKSGLGQIFPALLAFRLEFCMGWPKWSPTFLKTRGAAPRAS